MRVRFCCTLKEQTRERLHKLAIQNGRSDSNMVEYLIDNYMPDDAARVPSAGRTVQE